MEKFRRNLSENLVDFYYEKISYDELYDFLEGWISYFMHGDTYILTALNNHTNIVKGTKI